MIQRRTWKDVPGKTSQGVALPDGEGLMMGNTAIIGQMSFGGMTYQFAGMNPDDVAEKAARWLQQNTGQDEIEQLALIVGEHSFVLTKVGTAVVVSPSLIKPKVYR